VHDSDLIIDCGESSLGGSSSVASLLPSTISVALSINGDPVSAEIDTRVTLIDFLRERVRLTGTKKGLQPRRMRDVHGPGRWPARERMHDPDGVA
jgi:hypothetical protein